MLFGRFVHGDQKWIGSLEDEHTVRVWSAFPYSGGQPTDRYLPTRSIRILAPVEPSKIVAVGRNFAEHAAELGNAVPSEPLLFLKPPSSLLPHGGEIELPTASDRVEYEGELAVVIGKRTRCSSPDSSKDAVFGLTCANDVTARDLQKKDVQFTRGKGFDTFCPLGPWITTGLDIDAAREIRTTLNGAVVQQGNTHQMVFGIAQLISYISQVMTLEPGDVILTGTPKGVGPLAPGDRIEVNIEGLATLSNLARHRD